METIAVRFDRKALGMILSGLSCDASEDYPHSNETEKDFLARQTYRDNVLVPMIMAAYRQLGDK